jgi:hypothetical protein
MMEVIKIDPTARYVILVRDAVPEWAEMVQQSLREWFASDNQAILVNVPGQGQVTLQKIRKVADETVH